MSAGILLKDVLSIDLPPIEMMDIGAMVDGENRYEVLLEQNLGRVTGFEPNPEEFKKLQENTGDARSYFPHFLGDGEAQTFHLTRFPGCSSLFEPDPEVIDLFSTIGTEPVRGNFSVVETRDVATTRLDDIEDIAKPDFVKLDVQGAELMVMENGRETLSDVLILETEVEFIPLYKEQPLFGDIQTHLASQGFMLHKMIDIAGRPLRPVSGANPYKAISQLLWADAIFVRNVVDLSPWSDEQLIKASTILNDVYKSYDMVLRLLGEYDQRQKTSLAEGYMAVLKSTKQLDLMYMNLLDHC